MTKGIVVYFHEDFLGDYLLQKNELYAIKQLLHKSKRGMQIMGKTSSKVRKLMQEILELKSFNAVLQLLKILHTLSTSTEYRLLTSENYNGSLKRSDTDRMNLVYDYIKEHFRHKITLEELAALVYMTPSSFSRYFKSHSNKTFSLLLSEIRIGHASKLLIEQDLPIAEACFKSGFYTLSNFNRQFKRIHKMSPSEYKRAYLKI